MKILKGLLWAMAGLTALGGFVGYKFMDQVGVLADARREAIAQWQGDSTERRAFVALYRQACEHAANPQSVEECVRVVANDSAVNVGLTIEQANTLAVAVRQASERVPAPQTYQRLVKQ